ncbi:MAG TPA: DUF1801 domain-containing protein [Cytophagales bacterium]|jgi:hypothetical protein|nr:DUF1801 domain-containing protein [Cytophagales bacterium]
MDPVVDFIHNQPPKQKVLLQYLHDKLTREFGLHSKIRFKIPFYDHKSWVCYLNPLKLDGVELVFLKGQELSDVSGILQSKSRKMVAGITFESIQDYPESELHQIINEAILLDELAKKNK